MSCSETLGQLSISHGPAHARPARTPDKAAHVSLSRLMHLSKSKGRSPKAKPATEDAPTARLPGPSAKPSAVISAPDQIGPAAAVRGSRAGEPSCQPAPPAPQRPDRPTPQNIKDSERPIQSPGSAPLHPSVSKTTRTPPQPETGGRRPVGERGYMLPRLTPSIENRKQFDSSCYRA